MRYTVVQDFHTPLRRFRAGTEIDAADLDGSLSVERWAELKRLAPVKEAKPEPVPETAEERPAPRGAKSAEPAA